MRQLARLALALAASALVHLGAVYWAEKGGPLPPPAPREASVSSPPVEVGFLPAEDKPSSGGEAKEGDGALSAVLSERRRPKERPSPSVYTSPSAEAPSTPLLPGGDDTSPVGEGETPDGERKTLASGRESSDDKRESSVGEGETLASEREAERETPGGDAAGAALNASGGGTVGGEQLYSRGSPEGDAGVQEGENALQRRLQAHAHGCYPARARRFRFQGAVRLSFCVDMQGMAVEARLLQSSGHGSLDEAALGCVLQRAQPLPQASRGRCFGVPVVFGSVP